MHEVSLTSLRASYGYPRRHTPTVRRWHTRSHTPLAHPARTPRSHTPLAHPLADPLAARGREEGGEARRRGFYQSTVVRKAVRKAVRKVAGSELVVRLAPSTPEDSSDVAIEDGFTALPACLADGVASDGAQVIRENLGHAGGSVHLGTGADVGF
jgi:hypothetical protein